MPPQKGGKVDTLKLEFLMKKRNLDRNELMKVQDWSSTTYYRKMSGESDWTVAEMNNLFKLGFEVVDIIDIFLAPGLSETT